MPRPTSLPTTSTWSPSSASVHCSDPHFSSPPHTSHYSLTIPSRPPSPLGDQPTSPHPLLGCRPPTDRPHPTSPHFSPTSHLPPPHHNPPARRRLTVCSLVAVVLSVSIVCFYSFVLLQARFHHTALAAVHWDDYSTPDLLRDGVSISSVLQDEQWLRSQRVVVCGLLRDKEGQVAYLQTALPRLTSLFAEWAVVVVENNSTDNTRDRLLTWQQHDPTHVHVLGASPTTPATDNTTERAATMSRTVRHDYTEWRIRKMAALRNTYLEYVSSHAVLGTYELLIVMDLDLQSFVYIDGLLSTAHYLHTQPTIAAIAANGLQLTTAPLTASLLYGFEYQDPYAHEDERNKGKDVSQRLDNVRSKFVNRYVYGSGLWPVRSAFGGLVVYRMERVRGKRYGVTYSDNGRYVLCEHVSLHRQLTLVNDTSGGSSMYLNPSLMHVILDNQDGYVDRTGVTVVSTVTTDKAGASVAADTMLATI